jgi:anti-sigma factor RsiW
MSLPSAVDSTSSSLCPSHFVLDQMAVGELDHDSQRALERHLASCAACQARLAERRAAEADFIVDLSTLRALQQPPASDASDASSDAGAREAGAVSTRPTRSSPSSVGVVRWLSDRAPRVAVTLAAAAGLTLAFVSRDGGRIDGAADGAVLVGPAGTAVKEPSVRAKGSARSPEGTRQQRDVQARGD